MSTPDVSDTLRDALRAVPGLVSAYLFGSAGTGREHRESDVDVAVLVDHTTYPTPANRFELRLATSAALCRATGREVDLVILNDTPPQFARRIMTEGQRLLSNDERQERAHLRMVLSRAADLEPFLRRTRAVKLRAVER